MESASWEFPELPEVRQLDLLSSELPVPPVRWKTCSEILTGRDAPGSVYRQYQGSYSSGRSCADPVILLFRNSGRALTRSPSRRAELKARAKPCQQWSRHLRNPTS